MSAMVGPAYNVRVMTRAELDLVVDWAAQEGWNPGLDDARAFHASDHLGFLSAFMTASPSPRSRSSLMTRRLRSWASTSSNRHFVAAVWGSRYGAKQWRAGGAPP